MIREDFIPGWLLLVAQPWGARYNKTDHTGQPTADAKLQLEFYYSKLKHGSTEAWRKTAEQYAIGKEWPSLQDLRATMRGHEPQPRSLPDYTTPTEEPMPQAIKDLVLKVYGEPRRRFGPYVDAAVPEETHERA
jgi:hypothetical protein